MSTTPLSFISQILVLFIFSTTVCLKLLAFTNLVSILQHLWTFKNKMKIIISSTQIKVEERQIFLIRWIEKNWRTKMKYNIWKTRFSFVCHWRNISAMLYVKSCYFSNVKREKSPSLTFKRHGKYEFSIMQLINLKFLKA